MMCNAAVVLGFGFGLAGLALVAVAQPPAAVYRMGYLSGVGPPTADRTPQGCPAEGKGSRNWQALLEGLRERGYVQGRNLAIECRFTERRSDSASEFATELVRIKVDVLLAFSTPNVRAAKEATSTIPIVMVGVLNPVGRGLVDDLSRPGGNVTGLSDNVGAIGAQFAKSLQLLREVVPKATRVAVVGWPLNPGDDTIIGEDFADAARSIGVTLQAYPVRESKDLGAAFAAIAKVRPHAILVEPSPFMADNTERIVDLVAKSRLPAIYPFREHVEAGGLMAYDIDRPAVWRRIGYYVDKILKGARPADLPVEQPMKFQLIINLKTARALGLTIPQTLLLRADEVIQ